MKTYTPKQLEWREYRFAGDLYPVYFAWNFADDGYCIGYKNNEPKLYFNNQPLVLNRLF